MKLTKEQIEARKERARECRVKGITIVNNQKEQAEFCVENLSNGNEYIVIMGDGVNASCQCPDHTKLRETYRVAACKHIYSVLGYLGYLSLKDYIEHEPTARVTIKKDWDRLDYYREIKL